jgi:hypothetical protein
VHPTLLWPVYHDVLRATAHNRKKSTVDSIALPAC